MDKTIFIAINQGLAHPALDHVMRLVSSEELWIGIVLSAIGVAVGQKNRAAVVVLLGALICVAVSDAINSYVWKPLFDRARPCKDPEFLENVRIVVGCAGVWSTPSNHASNAAAGFLWLWLAGFRRWARWLLGPVLLVGFSRVYLGYHYPSDIILGFLWGFVVAAVAWLGAKKMGLKSASNL